VPETTLPITVVSNYHDGGVNYGDVDMPVEPLDHQVIDAWAPQPQSSEPSGTTVQLVNISGTAHKAATVASQLAGLGYTISGTSTGTVSASTSESVIRYHPGSVGQALGLRERLSGAVIIYPDPAIPDGSLTLDIGSAVEVSPPPTTAPPPSPAAPATTAAPAPTTTIPTAGGQPPSSSTDQPQPFDPTACAPAAR
jgi:hypothetical protein